MFSSQSDNCTPFVHIFDIIVLFAAELEESKIGIGGGGLTLVSDNKIFNQPKFTNSVSICRRHMKYISNVLGCL